MQTNTQATPTTFYRLPKVREIAGGVASSTIWGWVKNGTFPKTNQTLQQLHGLECSRC